jgi:DNA replication and repair protein RecF
VGVTRLDLRDFRCFARARVEASTGINLLYGPNGSGKTTILEAMHLLGTGRSFRVRELGPLVRFGAEGFELEAAIEPRQTLRAYGGPGGRSLSLDGETIRGTTALATALPVQALHPEMHALVEGPPDGRRRFMDWGVFHVKRPYLDAWRRYHRALRQRNAALKRPLPGADARVWDGELAIAGEQVDALRAEYVNALSIGFRTFAERLLPGAADVRYVRGWGEGVSLTEALNDSLERDRTARATQVGPHRADLEVELAGQPARYLASRGQQKILAVCLGLAQARVIAAGCPRPMVLLVDDPMAEVDERRAMSLAQELAEFPAQRFITGLTREAYPSSVDRLFHVKQGEVRQVI